MKPLRTWLARLGVFGALAIVSGCGGGDIPDPSADGEVAALPDAAPPSAPPAAVNVAAADAKAEEAKPEEAKPEETAVAQAQPEAESPAPACCRCRGAGPQLRDGRDAGHGEQGGPGPGARRSRRFRSRGRTRRRGSRTGRRTDEHGPGRRHGPRQHGPGAGMGPAAGMNPSQMQAGMQGQMQAQARMQGMRGAMANNPSGMPPGAMAPGGMAGGGGPGMGGAGNSKAPDFRTPQGAVQAFLDALDARDLGRLTDATALHAQVEADKRSQDMFKRIIDGSYSKDEIDQLAARLDGYKISSLNQARSSGRQQVVVSKQGKNRNLFRIVITARKERKGWGVCDISGASELKSPQYGMPRGSSKR